MIEVFVIAFPKNLDIERKRAEDVVGEPLPDSGRVIGKGRSVSDWRTTLGGNQGTIEFPGLGTVELDLTRWVGPNEDDIMVRVAARRRPTAKHASDGSEFDAPPPGTSAPHVRDSVHDLGGLNLWDYEAAVELAPSYYVVDYTAQHG